MQLREFGTTGINLSPVTFGSMRLDPQRIELDAAVELITYLSDRGVNAFHSSHEYETDAFFCQVMRRFRALRPQAEIVHIAKLGVPHFDESRFNSQRLVSLIESRLQALGTERIDLVQWLVRQQPNDDLHRLPVLDECQEELATTWLKLQQQGKVGALTSFPYSVTFAQEVLQFPFCQGLITYLNLLELEMMPFLNAIANAGRGYIAIRPLAGGLLTAKNVECDLQVKAIAEAFELDPNELTKFALQFPLLHPAVTSVMISVSSIEHAEAAVAAVEKVAVDSSKFKSIVKKILAIAQNKKSLS